MKQKLLTLIVSRTFKKDPGFLDRLAMRIVAASAPPVENDPEMDVPDFR